MTKQLAGPERGMVKAIRTRTFSTEAHDLVALVPGFMGFDHLGGLSYFADSVLAALRGAREYEAQRTVPVIGLSTLPAASLIERQNFLFAQLQALLKRYQPKRIHLIGHSTGGVDAYFATCKQRLTGSPWRDREREVRARLSSMTTLSSPLLGTTIADSATAGFIARPLSRIAPVRELVAASVGIGLLVAQNRGTPARIAELLEGIPSAVGLLHQLLRHRELIDDLSPHPMLGRCHDNPPDLDISRNYFATYVQPSLAYPSSSLFQQMYDATAAQAADAPKDHLDDNLRLLTAAAVIGNDKHGPLALDGSSNDGLCNTLRQLPPNAKQTEVGALIIGDHLDVMGYYDRIDPLTGREHRTSIFRSGAGFRDDQFFELFGSVAGRLS